MISELFAGNSGIYLLILVVLLVVFTLYRQYRGPITRYLDRRLPGKLDHHGLILILAGVGLVILFLMIASDVQDTSSSDFDRHATLLLLRLESGFTDAVMKFFTFLGDFTTCLAVIAILLLIAWKRKDGRAAAVLAGISAAEGLTNLGLKELYGRARPDLIQKIAELHSNSFPSGHTMGSTVVYGTIALILVRWYPKSEPAVMVLSTISIAMVGISRVYLGAHWPTDILAGWALGIGFLLVASAFLPRRPGGEAVIDETAAPQPRP